MEAVRQLKTPRLGTRRGERILQNFLTKFSKMAAPLFFPLFRAKQARISDSNLAKLLKILHIAKNHYCKSKLNNNYFDSVFRNALPSTCLRRLGVQL